MREFYGEDTVEEIYEERDRLRARATLWVQLFNFRKFILLARRYEDIHIDERGIHFRLAVLQPDITFSFSSTRQCFHSSKASPGSAPGTPRGR